MNSRSRPPVLVTLLAAWACAAGPAAGQSSAAGRGAAADTNRAPTAADWAALAKLPDWSGVWNPNFTDQRVQEKSNVPPWNTAARAQFEHLVAEERAGRPEGLFVNCLPEAMPSWMLISHDPMEILFTPGRVTLLGASDGNRLRRIYTDGREHPDDLDLSFHGHSIGHWEGGTLVVDTVGVLPQTYIATSEAVGVPNDGGMHIVERIHLAGPDELADDLEITAPRVLTAPWKTTRTFFRTRARNYEILEGVCLQGQFSEGVDEHGNAVFTPLGAAADGTPRARAE